MPAICFELRTSRLLESAMAEGLGTIIVTQDVHGPDAKVLKCKLAPISHKALFLPRSNLLANGLPRRVAHAGDGWGAASIDASQICHVSFSHLGSSNLTRQALQMAEAPSLRNSMPLFPTKPTSLKLSKWILLNISCPSLTVTGPAARHRSLHSLPGERGEERLGFGIAVKVDVTWRRRQLQAHTHVRTHPHTHTQTHPYACARAPHKHTWRRMRARKCARSRTRQHSHTPGRARTHGRTQARTKRRQAGR